MLSKLVTSYVLAAALVLGSAAANPEPDPLRLAPIEAAMMFDGVDTEVIWIDCEMENAFYVAPARTVVMCNELLALPDGVIRFIFAHELAHGVISQRRLPLSWRWQEYAADELAVLVLAAIGNVQDIRDAAGYWGVKARGEPHEFFAGNHPGHAKRGWMLVCLADEIEEKPLLSLCGHYWDNLVRTWVVLLQMH